ncbi:MAG: TolC family protein [Bacteroidota bacterium]
MKTLLPIFLLLFSVMSIAQDTLRLSLPETFTRAIANAIDLQVAESRIRENQYLIQRLQNQLQPQLFLNGTLPNLSRAIELRPLPDGRDAFVNRSTMNNGVSLSLFYQFAATGGTFTASSQLNRLDIFATEQFDYNKTYFFTPIAVGFNQPLFQFNELKWQRERYSLINAELTAREAVVREEVLLQAVQFYNRAYQAQIDVTLAQNNITETNALYDIRSRQAAIAKVQRVEILRLESEQQSNAIEYEQAVLDLEAALLELKDFLLLERDVNILLEEPPNVADALIDPDFAVRMATENQFIQAQNTLRLAEAEAEIERTNMDNGLEMSIDVSLGLNTTDDQLSQLYTDLLDRQTAAITLSVPLTGGKQRQLNRDIAAEQLMRERLGITQELTDISREVLTSIQSFNLLVKRIELERQNQAVSSKIYELVRQQFTLSKKSIIDLNIARAEQEQAFRQYYSTLLAAIEQYYRLRQLCLYDFVEGKALVE